MELIVVVLVVGAIILVVRSRRQSAGVSFKPAGAFRPPRDLEGRPGHRAAIVALARREAALLVRHPAFLVGLILFMPLMLLIGAGGGGNGAGVLSQDDVSRTLMLVPLGWAAILAANLCMLRSRRYGTEELFGGAALPLGSRTAGHLLACLATLPVSIGVATVLVVIMRLEGWQGWPRIEVFVVGPLIVLGGAVLGVAVARWLPWAVFGWVAVIATFVLQVNLGQADARFRWLHFSVNGNDTTFNLPEFQLERHGWHLVYLIGATLLVAAVALLRSPPTTARLGLLGVAVALVALGVYAQVQPPSATEAEVVASRLESPMASQQCVELDRVNYCSWPRYATWREGWRTPVQGVLSRVPRQVSERPGGIVVSQRPTLEVRSLVDPDLRGRVDPRLVFPREPVVHAGFDWTEPTWSNQDVEPNRDLELAYNTALVAVGLPDRPWWDESTADPSWATRKLHRGNGGNGEEIVLVADGLNTCDAGGEARVVVALWLAGQATDHTRQALIRDAGQAGSQDGDKSGPGVADLLWLEEYDTSIPPVLPRFGTVTTGDDVQSAVQLLALPDDRVAEVVRSRWNDLIEPSTPVSRIFELLDLPVPASARTTPTGLGGIIPPGGRCADLPAPSTGTP